MYDELIKQVEAAVLRRNPGLAAGFGPPLEPEAIRKELKKVGITEGIEPLVALYSWHNGAMKGEMGKTAINLGIAPPVVFGPDPAGMAYLQRLGHKIDPNQKFYSSFVFYDLGAGVRWVKLWKKYAHREKTYALMVGRYFPFMTKTTRGNLDLALEVGQEGKGRVVTIWEKDEVPVRVAYGSFEEFLRDVIRANERNEHLLFVGKEGERLGEPVVLAEPLPAVVKEIEKKAAKKAGIPVGENPFVLRVDFSDDTAWNCLCAILTGESRGFSAPLDFIEDRAYAGLTAKKLVRLVPEPPGGYAVIVDRETLSTGDFALLVVDLSEHPGRSFRAAAAAFGPVHDNLYIANMDFAEFAEAVGADGVFRGFEE